MSTLLYYLLIGFAIYLWFLSQDRTFKWRRMGAYIVSLFIVLSLWPILLFELYMGRKEVEK